MTKIATLVEKNLAGFSGYANLYKLDPPLQHREWTYTEDEDSEKTIEYEYVVVSGISSMWGTETYIFGADETGEIINWGELEGSFRGSIDHETALSNAGYSI